MEVFLIKGEKDLAGDDELTNHGRTWPHGMIRQIEGHSTPRNASLIF